MDEATADQVGQAASAGDDDRAGWHCRAAAAGPAPRPARCPARPASAARSAGSGTARHARSSSDRDLCPAHPEVAAGTGPGHPQGGSGCGLAPAGPRRGRPSGYATRIRCAACIASVVLPEAARAGHERRPGPHRDSRRCGGPSSSGTAARRAASRPVKSVMSAGSCIGPGLGRRRDAGGPPGRPRRLDGPQGDGARRLRRAGASTRRSRTERPRGWPSRSVAGSQPGDVRLPSHPRAAGARGSPAVAPGPAERPCGPLIPSPALVRLPGPLAPALAPCPRRGPPTRRPAIAGTACRISGPGSTPSCSAMTVRACS